MRKSLSFPIESFNEVFDQYLFDVQWWKNFIYSVDLEVYYFLPHAYKNTRILFLKKGHGHSPLRLFTVIYVN